MSSKISMIGFCLGLISAGLCANFVNTTENSEFVDQTSADKLQKTEGICISPYHSMNIGLRHIESKGIGYTNGYTTLEGFGICNVNNWFMPFLDLRGHVFDNGKLAGNVGIGARSYLKNINHILGYYLYYDVRQGSHNLTAQQLSPGIELLGKRMEYRINGYFPLWNQKSNSYDYDFNGFQGNNIILNYKRQYVMEGADAEVGVHLIQKTKYDFYVGAGPYYLHASHGNAWGGKVRLNGKYSEYVFVEASYSYDPVFRNIVQGSVGISIPLGKRMHKKGGECSRGTALLFSRAAQSPYRFEIPVIQKHKSQTKAVNPTTGSPWIVWFVNNTSSSSGTFESPFPTLAQAQSASRSNDIIYVFPGNGNALSSELILKNNQKLFGSGISQVIPTTKGQIQIPAFSKSYPLLINVGSNPLVTLANNNEVSGLTFTTTQTVTFLNGSNITGGNFHDNIGYSSGKNGGIEITGNGFYSIKSNQLTGFIGDGTNNGMSLTSIDGGTTYEVINNSISGYNNGMYLSANFAGQEGGNFIAIRNNVSNSESYGIHFQSFSAISGSTLAINGNTISSIQLDGIRVVSSKDLCGSISNNQIHTTGNNGIYFENDSIPKNFLVDNNVIHNPGTTYHGIECLSFDFLCLHLTNNVVTGGEGFLLETGGPGDGVILLNSSGNVGTLEIGSGSTVIADPNANCLCP